MKIVDRKTFLAMPAQTVFSKYEPHLFGALQIKGDTMGDDFVSVEVASAIRCDGSDEFFDIMWRASSAEHLGRESIAMDLDAGSRDGLFDADQLFAVWERPELVALVNELSRALAVAQP